MIKLSWLLAVLFLLSLFGWFNNRISYKYEVDHAKTMVPATEGSQAALAKYQARGQRLDQELFLIKTASAGLLAALALTIYKTPKP